MRGSPQGRYRHPAVPPSPTYRFLSTSPTRPETLLKRIHDDTRGMGDNPDQEAFATIGDLLREQLAPPTVTAALHRAAARRQPWAAARCRALASSARSVGPLPSSRTGRRVGGAPS